MSPATSTQVRRRQAARRDALERQRRLNEERRRRDEAEVECAADFALYHDEWVAAREALAAAEMAMGRVVDRMIGELRVRYPRAAQLLDVPEDELRRLRQLAATPAPDIESSRHDDGTGGEERAERPVVSKRGRTRARPEPSDTTASPTGAGDAEAPAHAADIPSGKGPQRDVSRDGPGGTPGEVLGDVAGGVTGAGELE